MNSNSTDFPPATIRTLQILDLFLEDPTPRTLAKISEELGIPFTSVYRIVSCMKNYQYLAEDTTKTNHIRLGYKLKSFSGIVTTDERLIKIAHPFMKDVCEKLSQACQLCVLVADGVCTIDQCLPKATITYISKLNEVIPVNVSASGKLLTGLLPQKERKRFIKKVSPKFTQYTENTITDLQLFSERIQKAATQKFCIDDEEYALGIGCLAVPIYTPDNKAIAAIGTTGPITCYKSQECIDEIFQTLQYASRAITKNLF